MKDQYDPLHALILRELHTMIYSLVRSQVSISGNVETSVALISSSAKLLAKGKLNSKDIETCTAALLEHSDSVSQAKITLAEALFQITMLEGNLLETARRLESRLSKKSHEKTEAPTEPPKLSDDEPPECPQCHAVMVYDATKGWYCSQDDTHLGSQEAS